MRKKLDTRFPAARIKKIMQADEEVGKIAMATPVLISKALELFLQDLCDRTYDITLKRGAKTMNSHHLKECVRSHSVFDFLRETVSRVPDLDAESAGGCETTTGRRRKAVDCDNDESCEEDFKRPRSDFQPAPTRGRGRGRGRGRRSNNDKTRIGEPAEKAEENEETPSPPLSDDSSASPKSPADDTPIHEGETSGAAKDAPATASGTASATTSGTASATATTAAAAAAARCPKDFDLNMELDENGEVAPLGKEEEYHSQWLGAGVQSSYTDIKLHHEQNVFQPEEDYDCEDEE